MVTMLISSPLLGFVDTSKGSLGFVSSVRLCGRLGRVKIQAYPTSFLSSGIFSVSSRLLILEFMILGHALYCVIAVVGEFSFLLFINVGLFY